MNRPILIAALILIGGSLLSAQQESPERTGTKGSLLYPTSTFFFQVRSDTDGDPSMTETRLRSRVGVLLRRAAMHPLYVPEHPQLLVSVSARDHAYDISVAWRTVTARTPATVWSVRRTGTAPSADRLIEVTDELVGLFLEEFLDVNLRLLLL